MKNCSTFNANSLIPKKQHIILLNVNIFIKFFAPEMGKGVTLISIKKLDEIIL